MGLVDRAKNILLKPKEEWVVIAAEPANQTAIITGYVLPLAAAAAVAVFIGVAFIGALFGSAVAGVAGAAIGIGAAFVAALQTLVAAFVGVFIAAAIVDALAPSFGSEKDFGRSLQLVAYSYTPVWVGSLLMIFPPLGIFVLFAGLVFAVYLFYLGVGPIKKTPEDKRVVYLIVFFVASAAINWLVQKIFGMLII